jgi:hypothetical protein
MKAAVTRRTDSIVNILTILAVMPFENGPLALIIPPLWKPHVAAAVVVAKVILDEMKTRQTATKSELHQKKDKLP